MPRFTWTPEMIAEACQRLAAGDSYEAIATPLGISHGSVAGLVYRLRFNKDPRLPEELRVANPARTASQRRARQNRAAILGPSIMTVADKPAIDDRNLDRLRTRAAIDGSASLLRAQLRAGQHLLAIPLARAVAERMGMDPRRVRRGIGDATTGAHNHA